MCGLAVGVDDDEPPLFDAVLAVFVLLALMKFKLDEDDDDELDDDRDEPDAATEDDMVKLAKALLNRP